MATKNVLTRDVIVAFVLLSFLFACGAPRDVTRTSIYHEPAPDTDAPRALNQLQLKALELMNNQRFDDAIGYLQRAIKIEPRDALNWHYLAQNYWHLRDFKTCRAMVERARAYTLDNDLKRANEALYQQCSSPGV